MSLSERKKQIIIDIASSYSNQIISNNQIKSSVVATSFINVVQDKKDADLCEKCMLTYLTQDDIDKAFQHNSNSNIYLELFNQIGKGVCGGLCYVNIEDIEQNNILIYDISSAISTDINIQKIIDYVKSETQKRYGYTDTSNNFDKSIVTTSNLSQKEKSDSLQGIELAKILREGLKPIKYRPPEFQLVKCDEYLDYLIGLYSDNPDWFRRIINENKLAIISLF